MVFILPVILFITIIYLVVFCKKVINFIYVIEDSKQESKMYEKFFLFKSSNYILFSIPLIITILSSKYITLKGWIFLYYLFWVLCLIFININLKLINHFLDVLFVSHAVTEVEKDFLIGAVKKKNNIYYFIYRLTNDSFKI